MCINVLFLFIVIDRCKINSLFNVNPIFSTLFAGAIRSSVNILPENNQTVIVPVHLFHRAVDEFRKLCVSVVMGIGARTILCV